MSFPIRKCFSPACTNTLRDNEVQYCSTECQANYENFLKSVEEQQESARIKRDYEFIEIEAQKINLSKNDTLMVTIKNDYVEDEAMQAMSDRFKKVFPNNKVFLFRVDTDGDIKFAVVTTPEKVEVKQNLGYCTDCDCGKKESAEKGAK